VTTKKKPEPAPDEAFSGHMEGFNFTAEDLESNQKGLISERQEKMLRRMGKNLTSYSKFGIKFMIGFVVVMFGIFFAIIASNDSMRKATFGDTSSLTILLVVIPIPILIMVVFYFRSKKQRVKYEKARLMMAEGRAEVNKKSSYSRYGPNFYWELKVGKFKLNLLDEHAALFNDGAIYRIYYVQVGRLPSIMSIEESG